MTRQAFAFFTIVSALSCSAAVHAQGRESNAVSSRVLLAKAPSADTSQTRTRVDSSIQTAPVKGFHPIKKAMIPIENLEALAIKLQEEVIKLEEPIAELQVPMKSLQSGAIRIDDHIALTRKKLDVLEKDLTGVRAELMKIKTTVADLQEPIENLRGPITAASKPLMSVSMKLSLVLTAIILAGVAIAFGVPLMAILFLRRAITRQHQSNMDAETKNVYSQEPDEAINKSNKEVNRDSVPATPVSHDVGPNKVG